MSVNLKALQNRQHPTWFRDADRYRHDLSGCCRFDGSQREMDLIYLNWSDFAANETRSKYTRQIQDIKIREYLLFLT